MRRGNPRLSENIPQQPFEPIISPVMVPPIYKKRHAEGSLSLTADSAIHYPAVEQIIIGALNERSWWQATLVGNTRKNFIFSDIFTLRKPRRKCSQPKFDGASLV